MQIKTQTQWMRKPVFPKKEIVMRRKHVIRQNRRATGRGNMIESLESRRLLAAIINGTAGAGGGSGDTCAVRAAVATPQTRNMCC